MAVNRSTKSSAASGARPTSNGRANHVNGTSPAAGSEPVRCGACRSVNPPTNKFCHDCGHRLWEPCHRCRSPNAANEKFCGACGANLFEWLQDQLARLDGEMETAEKLRDECRFDEALIMMRSIAALEDSRLQEFTARAAQRKQQWHADREAYHARAHTAEVEARQSIANHDYQRAVQVLEAVPQAIRTDGSVSLLEQARSSLRDIAKLGPEMATLARGPISAEVLGKVARLLTLRPDHREAGQLAARIANRLLEVAQARLADGRYHEVKRILEQVPEPLVTDALREIRDRASELIYLAWDIGSAPMVDECLLTLAARFCRLAPRDRDVGDKCAEIERRFQSHPRDPTRPTLVGAPLPETAAIGRPVEWATGLGRIALDPGLDTTQLLAHPGRFAVACGLALQGLVETAIGVNLLPDDEGLLTQTARWLTRRRARSAWGLDLGSSGLKAVKLTLGATPSEPVVLKACDVVEHEKSLSQAASESQQRLLVEESIRTFLARNDAAADRFCLGLPPGVVWIRDHEMPAMDPDKLDAAMEYEAPLAFPMPIRDLQWGYEVLDEIGESPDSPGRLRVALVGAKRVVLDHWLSIVRGLGLRIDVVQSDCLALQNFSAYSYFQPAEGAGPDAARSQAPLAIFDIGADTTSFLASGPDWVWQRASGLGADRVNKALVREFRITYAQAEQWKRNPAEAANTARLFDVLRPSFEDIFQEIKTALEAFEQAHPHRRVQRILCLGGGFRLHGLFRYLWLRK